MLTSFSLLLWITLKNPQQKSLSSKEILEINAKIAKESRDSERRDYSFVTYSWTHTDSKQDSIANAQVVNQRRDKLLAPSILASAFKKGLKLCGRPEMLRCVVALESPSVYSRSTINQNRGAIFERYKTWFKSLSLTEYKHLTLACGGAPQRDLIPAFDRLLRNAPFDWHTETASISSYIAFSRSEEGLSRARNLVKLYPKHPGTLLNASRFYDNVAIMKGDASLFKQAEAYLKVGLSLASLEADRRYGKDVEAMHEAARKQLSLP